MRDRLIKLLQDNSYLDVLDEEHWLLAAEQLLANGVVVIDTDVVSPENRPLISQCMGRPIDEVINLIRRSEWISVEERLPERGESVLVYSSKYDPIVECRDLVTYMRMGNYSGVTHWMHLPSAPDMKGGVE